ncbi:MAG: hypothetical protein OHK0015_07460 [Chloroflexi bacterium OHK40]
MMSPVTVVGSIMGRVAPCAGITAIGAVGTAVGAVLVVVVGADPQALARASTSTQHQEAEKRAQMAF